MQLPLVRLLEGYWGDGRLARFLKEIGTSRQARRRARHAAPATIMVLDAGAAADDDPDAASKRRLAAAG
ncbi:MAG: hypothetical protein ACR2LJ_09250 [Acidimicrobiales bacterium]